MFASGGVAEEMDVAADALGGVAVVAYAIHLARGLDVEAGGIDGRGGATGTGQGGLYRLGHLVEANDEDDLLGSPRDGGYTIAVAVDVDDDAILGNGVGTGEIDIGGEGAHIHLYFLIGILHEVAIEHLKGASVAKGLGDAHVANGHRTAPGDAAAIGNQFGYLLHCLCCRGAIKGLHMAALEVLDHALGQPLVSLFFR